MRNSSSKVLHFFFVSKEVAIVCIRKSIDEGTKDSIDTGMKDSIDTETKDSIDTWIKDRSVNTGDFTTS